jgi:hypothetical protein
MHEYRHKTIKESWSEQLSYFLLLPNLSAPLFPIIDYRTYINSYYDTEALNIYKSGFQRILKGMIQIWGYRIFYHYILIDFTQIHTPANALQFILPTFLLILRIIGLYHVLTGIIMMYGYNLPPIFNNLFFATGFSDLWKRINVYWKNFIIKIFYYPIYFRVKRIGVLPGMILTTFICFQVSWALHQWQWYWLKGSAPITLVDGLFWTAFGSLVAYNVWLQSRPKDKNKIYNPVVLRLRQIVLATGVFSIMAILFSIWTSPSIPAWIALFSNVRVHSFKDILDALALLSIYLLIASVNFIFLDPSTRIKAIKSQSWYTHSAAGMAFLILACLCVQAPMSNYLQNKTGYDIKLMAMNTLNRADAEMMARGYYDNLMVGNNVNSPMWDLDQAKPVNWVSFAESPLCVNRKDLLEKAMKPNFSASFKGTMVTTNNEGLRDRYFDTIKAPNTLRFAFFGGSYEFAPGVDSTEGFKYLFEQQLRNDFQLKRGDSIKQAEVINFAIPGYCDLQYLRQLELQGLKYHPDYAFFFVHSKRHERCEQFLFRAVQLKLDLVYDKWKEVVKKYKLDEFHTDAQRSAKYAEATDTLMRWTDEQLVKTCAAHGIQPVYVLYPATEDHFSDAEVQANKAYAEKLGFVFLDLSKVFDGEKHKDIRLAEWDFHPNKKGHELIANSLIQACVQSQKNLHLNINKK